MAVSGPLYGTALNESRTEPEPGADRGGWPAGLRAALSSPWLIAEHSALRPWFLAGWTSAGVLHALESGPDGSPTGTGSR